MGPTPEQIEAAARRLRAGELVVFPTETVYGLGACALDARAVARIFEAKGRPRFDPLIVHLPAAHALSTVASAIPPAAEALAARFWPGPLTLVLDKRPEIPDLVTAGHPTVAVRVPRHPVARALLEAAGVPVAAPSANRFGQVSPTRAEHVRGQLDVETILDGGPCEVGLESTIVSLAGDEPLLLRPGGVPLEAVEAEIGPVRVPPKDQLATLSPGRQARHYAPRTPLILADEASPPPGRRAAHLGLKPPADPGAWAAVEVLSASGDLVEAAAGLFSAMRRLDEAGVAVIVAVRVPNAGLGRAINDRLERAAAG